ncbi:MAG: type II toxin-antitoxin system RelE/ParE family toxin [Acidimicrobiales bacterium]|nr:type II toxin-antitoxin system RelE/ParE family toxin [Acidimicrobiales bacterium]
MRVRFLPEAEADLRDAYGWYDEQEHGLADEFLRTVDGCLAAIVRHPEAFPVVHRHLRRALLRRFPYGVFYLVGSDEVVVVGCLHAARDPKPWGRAAE